MGRGDKRTPPGTLRVWQKCAWVASFISQATLLPKKRPIGSDWKEDIQEV